MEILDIIKKNRLIAVIRGARVDQITNITDALDQGGIRTLEITMETPSAIDVIHTAAEQADKGGVIVGAGTVLDSETARTAILAGAQFIVSPVVSTDIVKMCNRYGVISIIGALTPTEILTAYETGADVIKVFPANAFGSKYLKDLSGPLPHIPLIPTGGINLDNVKEYLEASRTAAGLGSSLVNPPKLASEHDYKALSERANMFSRAIQ